jgi:hypothetical protein
MTRILAEMAFDALSLASFCAAVLLIAAVICGVL